MFVKTSSVILVALYARSVLGHSAITAVTGANGNTGAGFGVVATTPRDGSRRNPFQQDSSIIRDNEISDGETEACGRTLQGGNNVITQMMQAASAAGLPDAAADGSVTMTVHQVNGDGAGPFTCEVNTDGTGQTFQPMTVTTQVPGEDSRSRARAQDFPLVAQMPANAACAGGPNGDACIVRCRNDARAGPFGGCVAVTNNAGNAAANANAANANAGAANAANANAANANAANANAANANAANANAANANAANANNANANANNANAANANNANAAAANNAAAGNANAANNANANNAAAGTANANANNAAAGNANANAANNNAAAAGTANANNAAAGNANANNNAAANNVQAAEAAEAAEDAEDEQGATGNAAAATGAGAGAAKGAGAAGAGAAGAAKGAGAGGLGGILGNFLGNKRAIISSKNLPVDPISNAERDAALAEDLERRVPRQRRVVKSRIVGARNAGRWI